MKVRTGPRRKLESKQTGEEKLTVSTVTAVTIVKLAAMQRNSVEKSTTGEACS